MTATDRIYRLALVEIVAAFVVVMTVLVGMALAGSLADDPPPHSDSIELHITFL